MPKFLVKLLMLQRHQLIRWGGFNGYALMLAGAGLLLVGIIAVYLLEVRLMPAMDENDHAHRQTLLSVQEIENLRTAAIRAQQFDRDMRTALTEMASGTAILIFAMAFLSFVMSALCFRAKEMAIELKQVEERRGRELDHPPLSP